MLVTYFVFLVLYTGGANLQDISYYFQPGPLINNTQGQVWPAPQNVDYLDNKYFSFLPSPVFFKSTGNSCKTLTAAFERYQNILLFNNRRIKQIYYNISTCYYLSDPNFLGYLSTLDVKLTGPCNDSEYPSIHMKEDYSLTVNSSIRELKSASLWGIIRGLETFSQLIYITNDFSCLRVDTVKIDDFPRFPHRGFLLDTSRHYQAPENILKHLDAMSWNKFNVFHWHIVDDYSFPYVSKAFPNLSQKGAFNSKIMTYTQDFVKEVIEYARLRGIRVIPEFDTPGHTLSWGYGQPGLLTTCYNVPLLRLGPFNPIVNSTYDFIFKFFDEVKQVFKDQYTHLGGDEVDFTCWATNPDINLWLANNGIPGNYPYLQNYYEQKLINYVSTLNLNPIVWEEVFNNGASLPPGTVVNTWIATDPQDEISAVTAAGYSVVVSSYWYLDQLADGGDWVKYYNADPQNFNGTDQQKGLVIGGEVSMWTEVVDDNNLEPRVWPRASAGAEKFWSAPAPPIVSTFGAFPVAARLQEQACRLNRRGVRAQPAAGPSVCY